MAFGKYLGSRQKRADSSKWQERCNQCNGLHGRGKGKVIVNLMICREMKVHKRKRGNKKFVGAMSMV